MLRNVIIFCDIYIFCCIYMFYVQSLTTLS